MVVQEKMTTDLSVKGKPNQSLGLPVDRKHRLKHRFEVVKKLGQGTYGKVQLAVNKETGQEVAIKTIKKSKIESDQDLVRIRREIQIMSSVQHPHIIHIYEVFENKEKIVLVMQYASGGELYDYLSDKKILSDNEARRVFRQIAAAIYYCHKNKICHRDLKLENVLLDERGNAKIADFGLSNVFDDRHLLATYCGSPLYASPEIVKGTPYYGPEVDCWSMGVLLYTLVYGAMPFDGSNFKRLVKQISDGDYYEPKKKSEATGLIRRLLTVSPAKRATIIDICSDWWVNTGYEHSLLQVAEDTANLTPVRLDLLLALAPVSPPPAAGAAFKPSFATPTVPENAANVSSGVEDSCEEEAAKSHDGGDESSSSFAYISGGMASEMNVSAENPDDIFHQEQYEGSDEEFLPADVAAAMEGQCIKRPAEKSFDGSMIRVSSMAHKSKKPKKSDSLAASKKNLSAVVPVPKSADEPEAIEICKTDTLIAADQVMNQDDRDEKTPEPDGTAKAPEASLPVKEDEAPKAEEVKPEVVPEATKPKKKVIKKTESPDGTPTKEKKVKRKIFSSSALAANRKSPDKTGPDSSPTDSASTSTTKRSESPTKTGGKRVESPSKSTKRAESPVKRAESPIKPSKSPSPAKSVTAKTKTPDTGTKTTKSSESSSKITEPTVNATDSSETATEATKEVKKSVTTPGRILIRRRSEASPDKNNQKPFDTKNAAPRKPGKLVMPRFLEPTASTITTPKAVSDAPKKLVIPTRSVSDAKKAFEVKTKPSTPPPISRKSISEGSPKEDKVAASPPKTEEKPEEEAKKEDVPETTEKESSKEENKIENAAKSEIQVTDNKKDSVKEPATEEKEVPVTKPVEETEEEKKTAAKSILKKTLARARLAERKLSQQSSVDSEGSQCQTPPPTMANSLASTPTSQISQPSFFKIPKPYSKEASDSNARSQAEITLNKPNRDRKESVKSENQEETTIWGTPMSPSSAPSESKLKKSLLSSSVESDMNNWRTEVEESLKRLSPEGAAEENHSQTSLDSDIGAGPAPITRSYKKFTFTKDGSTITETGEVYTEPAPDGTWTKVEKKTKVTKQPTPLPPETKFDRSFKETSPLRHSDSQSSSGSNDVFDDIFDSWTGDSMFGNLLKMNSAFSRFAKDSLRRDRRRESLRRPKSDRSATRPSKDWSRGGEPFSHSTDRESSDNEEDFDFHFDGAQPVTYGSQGLTHFMKAMHSNFNDHLRSFKERHGQGSLSRSLSRDRDEPSRSRETRGRADCKTGASAYGTRSTSRDRTTSPRESVLRFVVDPSPRRQSSTRSEPRGQHQRGNSWDSKDRLSRDAFDDSVRESGVGSSWDGYASDHTPKHSSPLHSPDATNERAPGYGTSRPKGFQRYTKSLSKETAETPSTPKSTRSGPELADRPRYGPEGLSDNRRKRVEHWLETNPEDAVDPDNMYAWTTRSLLRDMPEFSSLYEGFPRTKSGFARYTGASTEKLPGFEDRPNYQETVGRDRGSGRSPMFRTISELQVSGNLRNSRESLNRDHYDFGSAGTLHEPPLLAEKPPPPRATPRNGSQTFTRSTSNQPGLVEITTNPDGSLEMETPMTPRSAGGPRTPVLRMRVSFNNSPSDSPRTTPSVSVMRESQVWPSTGMAATESGSGLWNQEGPSPWSSDFQDGSSLLEALKNRGYRNVMSQRLQHNPYSGSSLLAEDGDREAERATADAGSGGAPQTAEESEAPGGTGTGQRETDNTRDAEPETNDGGGSCTPKRGKACNSASSSPAETERAACCMMETNLPERNVSVNTVLEDDNSELDRSENSQDFVVEKIVRKKPETTRRVNGYSSLNGRTNGERPREEQASDGTLTPDSLDSAKERAAQKPKTYEEESVSERILRKSFYSRFNDDRPKRRSFAYHQDSNSDYSLGDLRGSHSNGGGLWSRFSDQKTDSPSILDDPYTSPLTRRASRRATKNSGTPEKRSSANLEDMLEANWMRKSDTSGSSFNLYEDYLSDDGLWATKPPLPSRKNSQKSVNGSSSSIGRATDPSAWSYEKPGSLWNQQRRESSLGNGNSRPSYRETSVIDTVPDLSESRRSSRSSFSFYSPTSTPRSPVFTSRGIVPNSPASTPSTPDSVQPSATDSQDQGLKQRRRSLVEPQFIVLEELEGRSRQSSGTSSSCSLAARENPLLIRNGSDRSLLSEANTNFDVMLVNNNFMPKEAAALLQSE